MTTRNRTTMRGSLFYILCSATALLYPGDVFATKTKTLRTKSSITDTTSDYPATAGVAVLPLSRTTIVRTPEAEKDRVTHLPGLNYEPNFEQFAGYIDSSKTRHVYYWYVESQSNPAEDPVILWSNGGPGCSGLLGFGAEHGPFFLNGHGQLHPNEYSWNRVANMLYVEQPAGVGFSYTDSEADKTTNDEQAAADNYRMMLSFFNKFPERRSNDFYFASESYGGHYVPQLILEILDRDPHHHMINLKGFLVGNPYVDPYSNMLSQFVSYYEHGLLARPLFDKWARTCKDPGYYTSKECDKITDHLFDQFGDGINPYALDYPVCLESDMSYNNSADIRPRVNRNKVAAGQHHGQRILKEKKHHQRVDPDIDLSLNPNVLATSSAQVDTLVNHTRQPPFLPAKDQFKPCSQVYMERYLNRHDIRSALHILDRASYHWEPCGGINYDMEEAESPVIDVYQKLVRGAIDGEHQLKMMIFSGDDDSICPTTGTQYWIWDLGANAHKNQTWQAWKLEDGQTAGFVTHFDLEDNDEASFIFATVHGAGHEVPAYRPYEALQLLTRFLQGTL